MCKHDFSHNRPKATFVQTVNRVTPYDELDRFRHVKMETVTWGKHSTGANQGPIKVDSQAVMYKEMQNMSETHSLL